MSHRKLWIPNTIRDVILNGGEAGVRDRTAAG